MKKLFIFLAAIVAAMSVNAAEVTLWSGTCTEDGVELNATQVAAFEVGDVLRITLAASETDGNIHVCYKSADDNWKAHQIPSADEYPWIVAANNTYDISFTEADLTALEGKNIYCYNGSRELTNISVIREDVEAGEEKILWSGTETLNWNTVATQSKITAALLGEKDKLIVTVIEKDGIEEWPQVDLKDNSALVPGKQIQLWDVTEFPYEGEITLTAEDVTALQDGFALTGAGATITKLVLKKYKNDGGATAVENTAPQVKGVKVLRDGIMYIQRGENLYNMQGQIVK